MAPRTFNHPINGLRGLSILMVFLHHVMMNGLLADFMVPLGAAPAFAWVADHGQYGVDLFFMISGFLIAGSLVRHADVRRFLLDRCVRIYPLFLCLHLLVFTAGPLIGYKIFRGAGPGEWSFHFVTNVLFLPGVFDLPRAQAVAWSLSYEALFYVVAAGVYLVARRFGARGAAFVVAAVTLPLLVPYPRAIWFVVGVVVYLRGAGIARALGRWSAPGLWLAIWFAAWNLPGPNGSAITAAWVPGAPELWALAAVPAGLFAFTGIVHGHGRLSALLETKPMQFLGTISYSFYLLHALVMFVVRAPVAKLHESGALSAPMALVVFGAASLPVAVAASWVSFELIERRLGKRLKRAAAAARAAPAAVS